MKLSSQLRSNKRKSLISLNKNVRFKNMKKYFKKHRDAQLQNTQIYPTSIVDSIDIPNIGESL